MKAGEDIILLSSRDAGILDTILKKLEILDRVELLLEKGIKEPEWVDKKEAMFLLGCKESTLLNLVKAGKISPNQPPKRGLHIEYNYQSIKRYKANPNA